MKSKKMWQALAIMFGFMLLSALIAWATGSAAPGLGLSDKWGLPFVFGIIFMIASVVFSLLRGRLPRSSWISLLLNSVACGLLIGAYLVGENFKAPLAEVVGSALAPAAFFLVLMAALTVPKLNEKRWYVILCYILWAVALFGGGAATRSLMPSDDTRSSYMLLFLFSVAEAGLALGALLSADSFWGLLYGMVTPSTVCLGLIAVIVLVALACGDGGDCDCGGCCDGCDCSPGYGSGKTKKTTMSELAGKLGENGWEPK